MLPGRSGEASQTLQDIQIASHHGIGHSESVDVDGHYHEGVLETFGGEDSANVHEEPGK